MYQVCTGPPEAPINYPLSSSGIFYRSRKVLDDRKTVSECDLQDGSELIVSFQGEKEPLACYTIYLLFLFRFIICEISIIHHLLFIIYYLSARARARARARDCYFLSSVIVTNCD